VVVVVERILKYLLIEKYKWFESPDSIFSMYLSYESTTALELATLS